MSVATIQQPLIEIAPKRYHWRVASLYRPVSAGVFDEPKRQLQGT